MVADRFTHAYIIESASIEPAVELAAGMLCDGDGARPCRECAHCRKVFGGVHPDLIVISRLNGESGKLRRDIIVAQIREITADASLLPNEAERKVYIIKEADTLNLAAQNAMLKLLEEPPDFCGFILSASNRNALLPTVRSRCVEIAGGSEVNALFDPAEEYMRILAKGSPTELLRFCADHEKLTADEVSGFVVGVTSLLTDALGGRRALPVATDHALELTRLFGRCADYLRYNVGTRHIWGLIAARSIE